MPRILLLIAIALIAYVGFTRYRKLPPAQQKQYFWQVLAIGGGTLLLLLVVTGRLHWIGAAVAASIPLLRRLLPLSIPFIHQHLKRRKNQASNAAAQQSTVAAAILSMSLDHASGALDGSVSSGPFAGQTLNQMSDADLLALYTYCIDEDTDSARLLESYLDQRLGPDWHLDVNQQDQQNRQAGGGQSTEMDRAQALAILGLGDDASDEEIVQAHRRLMQKLHPDRGGNDYLAAQINRARDILLS
jgi:hypothetical protein